MDLSKPMSRTGCDSDRARATRDRTLDCPMEDGQSVAYTSHCREPVSPALTDDVPMTSGCAAVLGHQDISTLRIRETFEKHLDCSDIDTDDDYEDTARYVVDVTSFLSCAEMNINSNGQPDSGDVASHVTGPEKASLKKIKQISIGDLPLQPMGLSLSGSGMRLYVGVGSSNDNTVKDAPKEPPNQPQNQPPKRGRAPKKARATPQAKKDVPQTTEASTSTGRLNTAPETTKQACIGSEIGHDCTCSHMMAELMRAYKNGLSNTDVGMQQSSSHKASNKPLHLLGRFPRRVEDSTRNNIHSSIAETRRDLETDFLSDMNSRQKEVHLCRSDYECPSADHCIGSLNDYGYAKGEYQRRPYRHEKNAAGIFEELGRYSIEQLRRNKMDLTHDDIDVDPRPTETFTPKRRKRTTINEETFHSSPKEHVRNLSCTRERARGPDSVEFGGSNRCRNHGWDGHCERNPGMPRESPPSKRFRRRNGERKSSLSIRPKSPMYQSDSSASSNNEDSDNDDVPVRNKQPEKEKISERDKGKRKPAIGVKDEPATAKRRQSSNSDDPAGCTSQPPPLDGDKLTTIIESTQNLQKDMKHAYKEMKHLNQCFSCVAKEHNNNANNSDGIDPTAETARQLMLKDRMCSIM